MARKEILPAIIAYENFIANAIVTKHSADKKLSCRLEEGLLEELCSLADEFVERVDELKSNIEEYDLEGLALERAEFCKDVLLDTMSKLRAVSDRIELILGKDFMPFPSYEDILYSVKY